MSDELGYPRVTEILQAYTSYHLVPPKILGDAAARGSRVHAICAGIAQGAWISTETIGDECIGYVRSFEKWFDETVDEVLVVEKRYVDEKLGYTGQIDLLVTTKLGNRCLVDLKTSSRPQKSYSIQMAAYRNLLEVNGETATGSMLVYLNRDGEDARVIISSSYEKEFHVFKCALICWRYFNARKVKSLPEDSSDNGRLELCPEGFSES